MPHLIKGPPQSALVQPGSQSIALVLRPRAALTMRSCVTMTSVYRRPARSSRSPVPCRLRDFEAPTVDESARWLDELELPGNPKRGAIRHAIGDAITSTTRRSTSAAAGHPGVPPACQLLRIGPAANSASARANGPSDYEHRGKAGLVLSLMAFLPIRCAVPVLRASGSRTPDSRPAIARPRVTVPPQRAAMHPAVDGARDQSRLFQHAQML